MLNFLKKTMKARSGESRDEMVTIPMEQFKWFTFMEDVMMLASG